LGLLLTQFLDAARPTSRQVTDEQEYPSPGLFRPLRARARAASADGLVEVAQARAVRDALGDDPRVGSRPTRRVGENPLRVIVLSSMMHYRCGGHLNRAACGKVHHAGDTRPFHARLAVAAAVGVGTRMAAAFNHGTVRAQRRCDGLRQCARQDAAVRRQ
jgi:hypothetical protein